MFGPSILVIGTDDITCDYSMIARCVCSAASTRPTCNEGILGKTTLGKMPPCARCESDVDHIRGMDHRDANVLPWCWETFCWAERFRWTQRMSLIAYDWRPPDPSDCHPRTRAPHAPAVRRGQRLMNTRQSGLYIGGPGRLERLRGVIMFGDLGRSKASRGEAW